MNYTTITRKEQDAIDALQDLAKRWPKSLWLFSASGRLCVMKRDDDGEKVMIGDPALGQYGGVDPAYKVCTIHGIANDGGDW
jgi:hypothetical protein